MSCGRMISAKWNRQRNVVGMKVGASVSNACLTASVKRSGASITISIARFWPCISDPDLLLLQLADGGSHAGCRLPAHAGTFIQDAIDGRGARVPPERRYP